MAAWGAPFLKEPKKHDRIYSTATAGRHGHRDLLPIQGDWKVAVELSSHATDGPTPQRVGSRVTNGGRGQLGKLADCRSAGSDGMGEGSPRAPTRTESGAAGADAGADESPAAALDFVRIVHGASDAFFRVLAAHSLDSCGPGGPSTTRRAIAARATRCARPETRLAPFRVPLTVDNDHDAAVDVGEFHGRGTPTAPGRRTAPALGPGWDLVSTTTGEREITLASSSCNCHPLLTLWNEAGADAGPARSSSSRLL